MEKWGLTGACVENSSGFGRLYVWEESQFVGYETAKRFFFLKAANANQNPNQCGPGQHENHRAAEQESPEHS